MSLWNSKGVMGYNFVREPLRTEDADALSHACETMEEKLIIWTLLDTGLRISELVSLTAQNILWQERAIIVSGKGGIHGKASKKRRLPMTPRVRTLLEHYFAINDKWFVKKRQAQRIVKQVAQKARIVQPVSAHVLRHTFASLTLQKGVSVAAVQKILGHDHHVMEEFHKKW